MNVRSSLCVVLIIVAAGWSYEASAENILVKNKTTGDTLFLDNGFEDDDVGTWPNDPTIGGYWDHGGKPGPPYAEVTDAASPGPYDGGNYFKVHRPDKDHQPRIYQRFDSWVQDGDTLVATVAFNYSFGAAAIGLLDGTAAPVAQLMAAPGYASPNYYFEKGSTVYDTGIAVTPGEWHLLTFEYQTGGTSLTFTVDDNTPYTGDVATAKNSVALIRYNGAANGTAFYLDGQVPEPSSVSLLVAGLAALGIAVWFRLRS